MLEQLLLLLAIQLTFESKLFLYISCKSIQLNLSKTLNQCLPWMVFILFYPSLVYHPSCLNGVILCDAMYSWDYSSIGTFQENDPYVFTFHRTSFQYSDGLPFEIWQVYQLFHWHHFCSSKGILSSSKHMACHLSQNVYVILWNEHTLDVWNQTSNKWFDWTLNEFFQYEVDVSKIKQTSTVCLTSMERCVSDIKRMFKTLKTCFKRRIGVSNIEWLF